MRTISVSKRLEAHKKKFDRDGRVGNLLRFVDLSEEEKRFIHENVAEDARVKSLDFTSKDDEKVYDETLLRVLSDWGIMCNHPESSAVAEPGRPGFNCGACETFVLIPSLASKKAVNK